MFGAPLVEAYGMTEAAHQIASNPPGADRRPGTVGRAAGAEIAIRRAVDAGGALDGAVWASTGEVGEVVIRGPGVTRGYVTADEQVNRDAFVDGWFRTGDLGRFDADGFLTLTGRSKELINRGGEKVSPREVDEVLLAHPGVAQAVAFAVPDPRLGEEVAAAVVVDVDAGAVGARPAPVRVDPARRAQGAAPGGGARRAAHGPDGQGRAHRVGRPARPR